ncbi:MAG: hypothetical protein BMS9Abin29_1727 [Gemmatimonadota bacterium]|nr:MAG: hypothetical protein BMS9Abin29_1727 [Gemmatimonadota bacterium]
MTLHEDTQIRGAFDRLRAEEVDLAPDFGQMLLSAKDESGPMLVRLRRRRIVRWVSGGAALAAAAIGGLLLGGRRADARFEEAVAIWRSPVGWTSATDFLLDTPGSELMRRPVLTSPRVWVGVKDSGIPMPTRGEARTSERNRS